MFSGEGVANLTRCLVAAGPGLVLMAAPALVAAPLLGAAGFGAAGVQAGSMAAAAQSAVGNIVAPSLFSTLQSAAMGGYGAAAVHGAVQGAGALMSVVGGSWTWGKGGGGQDGDEGTGGKDDEGEKDGGEEGDEGGLGGVKGGKV